MGNVLVLKGTSQYDALRIFADEMAKAFRTIGRTVYIVDFLDSNWRAVLQSALADECEFIFSYNALGADQQFQNGALLVNRINAPMVTLLVDHPTYNWERLNTGVHNLVAICVDQAGKECISKFMPGAGVKATAHLPHGAIMRLEKDYKEVKNRPIDLLFTGTYDAVEIAEEGLLFLPQAVRKFLVDIAEAALNQECESLEQTVEKVLTRKQVDFDFAIWTNIVRSFPLVHRYIRAVRRTLAIKRLVEAGIRVNVCGNGWENCAFADKLTIHSQRPFTEIVQLMTKAKICLDTGANFAYGGHERSLTAMWNHVPVVANDNPYYRENFKDGESITLFSHLDYDSLIQKVTVLLDDCTKLDRIASEGHSIVDQGHTIVHRASELLDFVNTYKELQSIQYS
jgi:glycosyltransferase involved in cell wall biosynthesis